MYTIPWHLSRWNVPCTTENTRLLQAPQVRDDEITASSSLYHSESLAMVEGQDNPEASARTAWKQAVHDRRTSPWARVVLTVYWRDNSTACGSWLRSIIQTFNHSSDHIPMHMPCIWWQRQTTSNSTSRHPKNLRKNWLLHNLLVVRISLSIGVRILVAGASLWLLWLWESAETSRSTNITSDTGSLILLAL